MKKMKIFEPLKLTKHQEKWLYIGVITTLLALLFYVMPPVIALGLIGDLVSNPIIRVIWIGIIAVSSFLYVHYTFIYGIRLCVRLAIRNYEIEQQRKKRRKQKHE